MQEDIHSDDDDNNAHKISNSSNSDQLHIPLNTNIDNTIRETLTNVGTWDTCNLGSSLTDTVSMEQPLISSPQTRSISLDTMQKTHGTLINTAIPIETAATTTATNALADIATIVNIDLNTIIPQPIQPPKILHSIDITNDNDTILPDIFQQPQEEQMNSTFLPQTPLVISTVKPYASTTTDDVVGSSISITATSNSTTEEQNDQNNIFISKKDILLSSSIINNFDTKLKTSNTINKRYKETKNIKEKDINVQKNNYEFSPFLVPNSSKKNIKTLDILSDQFSLSLSSKPVQPAVVDTTAFHPLMKKIQDFTQFSTEQSHRYIRDNLCNGVDTSELSANTATTTTTTTSTTTTNTSTTTNDNNNIHSMLNSNNSILPLYDIINLGDTLTQHNHLEDTVSQYTINNLGETLSLQSQPSTNISSTMNVDTNTYDNYCYMNINPTTCKNSALVNNSPIYTEAHTMDINSYEKTIAISNNSSTYQNIVSSNNPSIYQNIDINIDKNNYKNTILTSNNPSIYTNIQTIDINNYGNLDIENTNYKNIVINNNSPKPKINTIDTITVQEIEYVQSCNEIDMKENIYNSTAQYPPYYTQEMIESLYVRAANVIDTHTSSHRDGVGDNDSDNIYKFHNNFTNQSFQKDICNSKTDNSNNTSIVNSSSNPNPQIITKNISKKYFPINHNQSYLQTYYNRSKNGLKYMSLLSQSSKDIQRMCLTQHGSKEQQTLLLNIISPIVPSTNNTIIVTNDEFEKSMQRSCICHLFDSQLPIMKTIMGDMFGNYFIQILFEHLTKKQCILALKQVNSDQIELCYSREGTRTVQKQIQKNISLIEMILILAALCPLPFDVTPTLTINSINNNNNMNKSIYEIILNLNYIYETIQEQLGVVNISKNDIDNNIYIENKLIYKIYPEDIVQEQDINKQKQRQQKNQDGELFIRWKNGKTTYILYIRGWDPNIMEKYSSVWGILLNSTVLFITQKLEIKELLEYNGQMRVLESDSIIKYSRKKRNNNDNIYQENKQNNKSIDKEIQNTYTTFCYLPYYSSICINTYKLGQIQPCNIIIDLATNSNSWYVQDLILQHFPQPLLLCCGQIDTLYTSIRILGRNKHGVVLLKKQLAIQPSNLFIQFVYHIIVYFDDFVNNNYGNYQIQYIIEHTGHDIKNEIINTQNKDINTYTPYIQYKEDLLSQFYLRKCGTNICLKTYINTYNTTISLYPCLLQRKLLYKDKLLEEQDNIYTINQQLFSQFETNCSTLGCANFSYNVIERCIRDGDELLQKNLVHLLIYDTLVFKSLLHSRRGIYIIRTIQTESTKSLAGILYDILDILEKKLQSFNTCQKCQRLENGLNALEKMLIEWQSKV